MKSIMQEASTIAKAVEQGWIKAQKPSEFSIKVLEEPQHNFFGLTTRTAKVALFFDDRPVAQRPEGRRHQQAPRPAREQHQRDYGRDYRESQADSGRESSGREPNGQTSRESRERRPMRQTTAPQRPQNVQHVARAEEPKEAVVPTEQQRRRESQWKPEMAEAARAWLTETFVQSNTQAPHFRVEIQQFHLRVIFDAPVLADREKEKQLFASFATLIIEMTKQKYRIGLRGHKVVLTHP